MLPLPPVATDALTGQATAAGKLVALCAAAATRIAPRPVAASSVGPVGTVPWRHAATVAAGAAVAAAAPQFVTVAPALRSHLLLQPRVPRPLPCPDERTWLLLQRELAPARHAWLQRLCARPIQQHSPAPQLPVSRALVGAALSPGQESHMSSFVDTAATASATDYIGSFPRSTFHRDHCCSVHSATGEERQSAPLDTEASAAELDEVAVAMQAASEIDTRSKGVCIYICTHLLTGCQSRLQLA